MIAPDVWFTLYVLAQEGAVHKRAVLTTRKLGDLLGVSQQTASRRVTYCAEEGYVSRVHTANGMLIQLSKKGVKELKGVMTGLELALVPREEEIVIAGRVVHGLGEGAYYVDAYSPRFHESLGFEPYSGTLNVKIVDDDSRSAINRMKQTPPLIVPGFTHEGRSFGDVVCYRVRVNQKVDGAVVIAQRTHHGQEILEIISEVNLRSKLKLKDNDLVTLTIVPLHRV
jgi:riboflavin kinase